MKPALMISLAALVALSGCASSDTAEPESSNREISNRECISPRGITNWHAIGDDYIHLESIGNNHFLVEILGVCPNLDIARGVALRSSGWLCGNDIGQLVYSDAGVPRRCRFTNIGAVGGYEDAKVKAAVTAAKPED